MGVNGNIGKKRRRRRRGQFTFLWSQALLLHLKFVRAKEEGDERGERREERGERREER